MRPIIIIGFGAIVLSGCASSRNESESAPVVRPAGEAPDATLLVRGMSCPNCATNVDKQLAAIPGVRRAEVNLGTGEVFVVFDAFEEAPSDDALRQAVRDSGYTLDSIRRK